MSHNNRGLLKSTFIYGLGTFGSKILVFLIVPLYSYYLNKSEFGYFDLILTSINLFVPFLTFQISDSIFRWLVTLENKDDELSKIITNTLFILFFSIILTWSIAFIWYLIKPLKGHWLIFLMTIFAMIYPNLQQILRGLGKNKKFAINGVIYTITYLIGNLILLVVFKLGIEALILSNIIGYLFASAFVFFGEKIYLYININKLSISFCKELISYSIPLIPNTISWWLINSANKFIVLSTLGVAANGIFAMANRFPVVLVMVNQVFTLAWQDNLIGNKRKDLISDGKSEFNVLLMLIKVQFILVFILTLLSKPLVTNLLSSEYYESWKYMPIMFLSVAFLSISSYYGAFYLKVKKTKKLFATTIIGGLSNIVFSIFSIKCFGLMGVTLGTAFGFLILTVIRAIEIKKWNHLDFPIKVFLKYLFIVFSGYITVFLFNEQLPSIIIGIVGIIYIIYDNFTLLKLLKKKQ